MLLFIFGEKDNRLMNLHKLIKQKRENNGWTQDYVAQSLNVTRQVVQNWETNKLAIPNDLLAAYFNLLEFDAQEILDVFDFIGNNTLVMAEMDYSIEGVAKFEFQENQPLLRNYPTLYFGVGRKKNQYSGKIKQLVYVGEASSIIRRTLEHLKSEDDKLNAIKNDSDEHKELLYVIGHSKFNKSATLELEQMFMDYMLGDDKFEKIYNSRNNGLSADFYGRTAYRTSVFPAIWEELRVKNIVSSLGAVRNSALFANSPFKSLSPQQEKAKNEIGLVIAETLINGTDSKVIKIQGLAGSGKTVLMSQLFYDIWCNPYPVLNGDGKTQHHSKITLLVRHDQQLRTYEQIAKKLNMGIDAVMDVPRFVSRGEKVDILLVDEAHLLWSGNYGRVSKKIWQPDLVALQQLSRTMVIVYDPNQIVSTRNKIDDNNQLFKLVNGIDTRTIFLEDQWRIRGNLQTQNWIKNLAHFEENALTVPPKDKNYDIQFFEDAQNFKHAVEQKNQEKGISRIVATYDWEYSQGSRPKNSEYWMVTFGQEKMPWNLELPSVQKAQQKQVPWQEIKESINEVGSDFTVQGTDLNYVGVILGPSVFWNVKKNTLDINANRSYDHSKIRKQDGTYNTIENKAFLKNVINVLLTRGVHGLYIYAVDTDLRQKLVSLKQDRL